MKQLLGKLLVPFKCNVCGSWNLRARAHLTREHPSCRICGSSVRMRAVVHHVSRAIFGKSIALPDFPLRKDIKGVGLSDWVGYAVPFAEKLDYTNTYYHTDPFLDITKVPDAMAGTCDFVVSTDVFEHVTPPVARAFDGALRLLKPGGTLVLTVPFALEVTYTKEHFPHLHKFEIEGSGDGPYKLTNTRESGEVEVFEDPVFHGGPGQTLEMREFARESIRSELQSAGFTDITFAGTPFRRFGIVWPVPWSVPITARAPARA